MYTLFLAGILGLGAAGCGSGGNDGGSFDVNWSLIYSDGTYATCAGTYTTEVDIDVLNVNSRVDYHDKFACSDRGGTTASLPVGDYTVALRAYDSYNNQLSEFDLLGTYPIYAGTVTALPDVTLEY
jgi:hypothetical protein